MMTKNQISNRIFGIWGSSAALISALILAQSIGGAYGSDSGIVWTWFLTIFSSPLGLIIVAISGSPSAKWKNSKSDKSKYHKAIFSILLLTFGCILIFLLEPFSEISIFTIIDMTLVPLCLLQGAAIAFTSSVIFDGR